MKLRESSVITKSHKITSSIREDIFGPPLFAFLFFGFLVYANTFANFWSFDDYYVILKNPDITSWQNFLANSYPGRPLRELSAMLDYKLFGFNPFGWHFQNIFWHSLNAWLVYVLSMLLLDERRIAWLAATLFLVHPVQVEVVAQVSHRKDSLALFFMLAAFIFYLLFNNDKRIIFLLLSILSMVIAFFAKQNSLVFPFIVLFSAAFLSRKRLNAHTSVALSVAAGLTWGGYLAMSLSTYKFLTRANDLLMQNNYLDGFDWFVYPLAVLSSWGFLLSKLIWPSNLSVGYVVPIYESVFESGVWVSLVLLCVYLYSLYYSYIHHNKLFIPILWFGVLYLPTANILPITQLAADRYLYAPSVGFFIVFSIVVVRSAFNKILIPCALIAFFGLALMTIQQNRAWQNNTTLWEQSLKVNPNSVRAIINVADLKHGDDVEKSLSMNLRAFELNPFDPFVCYKIGELYERSGREEKAKVFYKKAYEFYDPSLRGMYNKSYYAAIKQKLAAFNISVH